MPVEHLIPIFGGGPMRMPPVGPCQVIEAEHGAGVTIRLGADRARWAGPEAGIVLDARQARQLAEQILFVIDGSVIVATNRLEGY